MLMILSLIARPLQACPRGHSVFAILMILICSVAAASEAGAISGVCLPIQHHQTSPDRVQHETAIKTRIMSSCLPFLFTCMRCTRSTLTTDQASTDQAPNPFVEDC